MGNIPVSDLLGGILTVTLIASSSFFVGEALISLLHGRLKLAALLVSGIVANGVLFILAVLMVGACRRGLSESAATIASSLLLLLGLISIFVSVFVPSIIAVREKNARTRLIVVLNCLGLVLPFVGLVAHHHALRREPKDR